MNIDEKIRSLMAEIFMTELELCNSEITPKTVAQWDSLSHIKLMLALEREFAIRIPDEQIVMLASFREITDAVHKLAGEERADGTRQTIAEG
ncbi:MAG TPA: acyl carrier protein [Bacteroidota bacterium]|nr:acyl carrier protein [Bacteroidota bacterium]